MIPYALSTQGIRVAIIPCGYPFSQLTKEQSEEARTQVFSDFSLHLGGCIILCDDNATKDWLINIQVILLSVGTEEGLGNSELWFKPRGLSTGSSVPTPVVFVFRLFDNKTKYLCILCSRICTWHRCYDWVQISADNFWFAQRCNRPSERMVHRQWS